MNIQKACEELERLLERDIKSRKRLLNSKEFAAINKILLRLEINGFYKSN
ncbi:hypothetical protein [Oceanobacillus sp. FSL H7-0719]